MHNTSTEEFDKKKIINQAKDRMQKSFDSFQRDINTIRSNRATPSMVDGIKVEYYGTMTPLNQLATIAVPEARVLTIAPFDKGSIADIDKAIQKSDLNITPQNDGVVIRLILPELSMDRRKELVKQLKTRTEEGRVSIRNIRRDTNDLIKKVATKNVSEDEIKQIHDEIQHLTDSNIAHLEEASEKKEKEILTV